MSFLGWALIRVDDLDALRMEARGLTLEARGLRADLENRAEN